MSVLARDVMSHPWLPFVVVPLFFGVMMGGGILLGSAWMVGGITDAEHKLCDQAVAALLHSKDLIEVQRAGIIIRQVNCGIGNRLMGDQK